MTDDVLLAGRRRYGLETRNQLMIGVTESPLSVGWVYVGRLPTGGREQQGLTTFFPSPVSPRQLRSGL